jgi:hypothetical protein
MFSCIYMDMNNELQQLAQEASDQELQALNRNATRRLHQAPRGSRVEQVNLNLLSAVRAELGRRMA